MHPNTKDLKSKGTGIEGLRTFLTIKGCRNFSTGCMKDLGTSEW